jgi:hypothetical protein
MFKKLSALMIALVLMVAYASYRVGGVQAANAMAAGPTASEACALRGTASLSVQELKDVLNARYEHRCCGLPR